MKKMSLKSPAYAALAILFVTMNLLTPAEAQSLRDGAAQVFMWIYGLVGILGALAVMLTGINWMSTNFFGFHDPKKMFFNALFGTVLALGSVAIIQAIKSYIGTANVSNL
jgi:hypothetical protein